MTTTIPRIDFLISIWSMRPQPGTVAGSAWEEGAREGYEHARSLCTSLIKQTIISECWRPGFEQGFCWGRETLELDKATDPVDPLHEAVRMYREVRSKVAELKAERFKVGDPVKVDCSRFQGWGRVAFFGGDSLEYDELPVVLENGNTWHYPVDACEPAAEDAHPMIQRCPNYAKR